MKKFTFPEINLGKTNLKMTIENTILIFDKPQIVLEVEFLIKALFLIDSPYYLEPNDFRNLNPFVSDILVRNLSH